MRRWFVFLLALIMAVCCAGCFEEAPTESVSDQPQDVAFSIPGTLVADNFDLTIVSAEVCDSVVLNSGIDFTLTPDEGKQFLVLCIDAKNTSDSIMNLGSLMTYVDNITILPHNGLAKLGDRVLFVGGVHPGKTICTYILYQVPTNWEKFELAYVDGLTCAATKTITIFKSDIA